MNDVIDIGIGYGHGTMSACSSGGTSSTIRNNGVGGSIRGLWHNKGW